MRSVRIANERSDLCYLVSIAIKTTYHTQSLGGVERCIDVLKHLKSLSLSVKDIQLSESIVKLDTLRRHRNPKIRKETQALFHSWLKTLYADGRDNSLKAGLTTSRLKPKKSVLTRCSELKKKKEQISLLTHEPEEIKKETNTDSLELKTREFVPKTRETNKIKKETKTGFFELWKKEEHRSLTHEGEEIKKKTYSLELKKKEDEKTSEEKDVKTETKTDLKPLNLKKRGDACEAVTTKKPRGEVKVSGNQKMCSITVTPLAQHSRRNIKDKDGQVTTKTLIPPPRRDNKNIPSRPICRTKQQHTGPTKDFSNPKSAALKTKTEEELKKKKTELVDLFEEAKKAANVANAKGILLGRAEASRCVDALSLLMRINITPKPKEPRRMMERLEGLTKHKDRKICSAASALLQLWRQRIREQKCKDSATKTFPINPRKAHDIRNQDFVPESLQRRRKLVM